MLRLFRNHSAFNSHNFPRTYTTTYLFSMLLTATIMHQHVMLTDSEITSRLQLYSRIGYRLFPLLQLVGLFRCRFSSGLCTTPCGITRHPSCHCVFSIFSLLAGIARCTSLGVCSSGGNRTLAHGRVAAGCSIYQSFTAVSCGRWRSRTACSSEAFHDVTLIGGSFIPFAGLHLYSGFSFLYLSNFMSSYTPSTMF